MKGTPERSTSTLEETSVWQLCVRCWLMGRLPPVREAAPTAVRAPFMGARGQLSSPAEEECH